MDTDYLYILYEYYREIEQQALTLQDIQTRIMLQQSFPLYCLRPTIHERDAHRKI